MATSTVAFTAYEIPLTAQNQAFSISLSGVTYNLTVKWNNFSQCWVLDIADENDNDILTGVQMTTGEDLLAPYAYLQFGGQLYVQTDNSTLTAPTYTNLGSTSHLYFIVVND
jgi:hypothetical protein